MTTLVNQQPIRHVKLSNILKLSSTERSLIRITGNVELDRTNAKELILVNRCGQSKNSNEVLVDLSCLVDFNLNDINVQHDLVQFIGSRDMINTNIIRFKALHFRVIRRTSLESYYTALNIQNNYLRLKGIK